MNLVISVVTSLVIIGITCLVKLLNKKAEKNMDETRFEVRQPIVYLVVSIITTVVFGAGSIYTTIFLDDTLELWVYFFLSILAILGVFLTIYCLSWKIVVENENIVFSRFLGIKRYYAIKNITKVIIHNRGMKVFSGKKKLFSVENTTRGYNVLIARLKKEQISFDDYNINARL